MAYAIGAFGLGMSSMTNLVVPLRAHELGASLTFVGLIVAAGAVAPAVLSVPIGGIIDRFGARETFILGAAATSLIAIIFVTANAAAALLLLQFGLGAVRSLGWVASQSYIGGYGAPGDRTKHTGRFSVGTNLGKLTGPLAVGAIADITSLRTSFAFIAVVAAGFALLGSRLPRIDRELAVTSPGQKGSFSEALALTRIPGIRVALSLTLARLWVATIWASFFPLVLASQGVSTSLIGTVLSFSAGVATVAALAAGRLTRRRSSEAVALAALVCGAVGLIIAPHLATIPQAYLPGILTGVASGISLPLLITVLSDHAPPGRRGLALGLRMSANQTASAVAPSIAGPLMVALGGAVAFGTIGGVAVVGLGLTGIAVARLHR